MSFNRIVDQETEIMEEPKHDLLPKYLPPPPGRPKRKPGNDGPIKDFAVAEEKSAIASPPPSTPPQSLRLHKIKEDEIAQFSIVEMPTEIVEEEIKEDSVHDTESLHGRVEVEKQLSQIKACENRKKSMAENRIQKKYSEIISWENSEIAYVEAEMKKFEEKQEKKKAKKMEKAKNKLAKIRQTAEARRAKAEARRKEDFLKAEEEAKGYRATGTVPKEPRHGCFGQSFTWTLRI